MQRLTVTSFVNSQDPVNLIYFPSQTEVHFDRLYAYIFLKTQQSKGNLKIFPLINKPCSTKEGIYQKSIQLQIQSIGNIVRHKDFLIFHEKDKCELIVYDLISEKMMKLPGHILPITTICQYCDQIVTGSKDMTVRFWSINKKNNKINITGPKASTEHSGKIICLKTYGNFLISTSQDKTLKFWHKNSVWTSQKFQEVPEDVCLCPTSEQIIVYTKDKLLHFISVPKIAQTKKIIIRQSLPIQSEWISGSQTDQSFMIYCDKKDTLNFIEVNLVKNIHQKKIQAYKVLSKGKLLFFANKQGIFMIKM